MGIEAQVVSLSMRFARCCDRIGIIVVTPGPPQPLFPFKTHFLKVCRPVIILGAPKTLLEPVLLPLTASTTIFRRRFKKKLFRNSFNAEYEVSLAREVTNRIVVRNAKVVINQVISCSKIY
jgi:hypothetical protein